MNSSRPHKPILRPRTFLVLAVFSMVFLRTAVSAPATTSRLRGRLLRTEEIKTEHHRYFECRLIKTRESVLKIGFSEHELVSHFEANIYEVLLQHRAEGESDETKNTYEIVPDETIRGETTVRTETLDLGPLANQKLVLNRKRIITTDEKGTFTDSNELILGMLDDLGKITVRLTFTHAELGTIDFEVERRVIPHPDKPEGSDRDVLKALGLDFSACRLPDNQKISFSVEYPEKVRAGECLSLTFRAKYEGDKNARAVMAKTFSRHPWLNGKNFYIGNISPGEERSFTRNFTMPENQPGGEVFGLLSVWDILGATPDGRIPLRFTVTD